ncbi:MAG: DUF4149 domain-containing protein [Pseudomonadota bacterium]
MLDVIALLAIAILFGGMASFSFLFAPLVFARLPAETAGPFIRSVFPWYYLFVIVLGGSSAALMALSSPDLARILFAVFLTGILARQVLMPAINRARERHLGGDAAAHRRFQLLHGSSLVLNVVQLIGLGFVVATFAF